MVEAVAQAEFLELLIILTGLHCNSNSDFERISSDIKGQRLVQHKLLLNLSLGDAPKIFQEQIILMDRKMGNSRLSYFLLTLWCIQISLPPQRKCTLRSLSSLALTLLKSLLDPHSFGPVGQMIKIPPSSQKLQSTLAGLLFSDKSESGLQLGQPVSMKSWDILRFFFTLDLWLLSILKYENNFKWRTNVTKTCQFANNFQAYFLLFTRDREK